MKTVMSVYRCCLALITAAAFGLFFPPLHAQSPATGTVQGRVYNPVAQEYVRNAEVRLEGTNQITYTENDGSFQFTSVPAGTIVPSPTVIP